jgi:type VI protein secretion system component Hcp
VGEALSTLSLVKSIDSASCDLMFFSMQDRLKTKSTGDPLTADIHFVEVVGADTKPVPYLRIRLENVLIKSWGIEADKDDRPTEKVLLKFDRAAMQYHATSDGKTFEPAGKKGWDQVSNQAWIPKTEFFP